jgi:hypothetical protein
VPLGLALRAAVAAVTIHVLAPAVGPAVFALVSAAVIFFAAGAGGAAAGLALRAVALGRVTRPGARAAA